MKDELVIEADSSEDDGTVTMESVTRSRPK